MRKEWEPIQQSPGCPFPPLRRRATSTFPIVAAAFLEELTMDLAEMQIGALGHR